MVCNTISYFFSRIEANVKQNFLNALKRYRIQISSTYMISSDFKSSCGFGSLNCKKAKFQDILQAPKNAFFKQGLKKAQLKHVLVF